MSNPLVFESTESVIAILWDIALAVFVVRLAFFYVVLTAAATGLFAWAAHALLPLAAAHLPAALTASLAGPRAALLAVSLPAIAIPLHCNGAIVYFFEVPRVGGFRLAIGAMAGVYVALGSLLARLLVPSHCQADLHAAALRMLAGGGGNGTLAALAALAVLAVVVMPFASMVLLERPAARRSAAELTGTPDGNLDEKNKAVYAEPSA